MLDYRCFFFKNNFVELNTAAPEAVYQLAVTGIVRGWILAISRASKRLKERLTMKLVKVSGMMIYFERKFNETDSGGARGGLCLR